MSEQGKHPEFFPQIDIKHNYYFEQTDHIDFVQWFGFAKIEWTDAADDDLRYYEVYKSHTNAWGGEEFLETKTPGKAAVVQGNAPVDAVAASPDATNYV